MKKLVLCGVGVLVLLITVAAERAVWSKGLTRETSTPPVVTVPRGWGNCQFYEGPYLTCQDQSGTIRVVMASGVNFHEGDAEGYPQVLLEVRRK